eukprot:scaffold22607_cov123-Cylindrotheca_fusiformis.AAC.23
MAPPSFALGPPAATSPPSTPARRIPVYSSFDKKKQQKVTKSRKSTLIIHSNEMPVAMESIVHLAKNENQKGRKLTGRKR